MLFNSLDFAIFLPIVFTLYWLANKNLRLQNTLVVAASYLFYGWWDWRFLLLIALSTSVDYAVGLALHKQQSTLKRKLLLWLSISANLGLLGVFKYYNFFIENFITAFSLFGKSIELNSLNIVLPVGISFYTFQTLSYTIDIYHRKLAPTKNFVAFAAFVSFFPQLVAGPIERATNLLPQFMRKRVFNSEHAWNGVSQILWGLFKKMVIADNCAHYADLIFNHSNEHTGSTLVLGAIFFAFQIYGDFSGYSDIAIGTAKLFGFRLMRNFAFPYFSRDIAEFWRRWHISLSTWFRDYLYIPLGGSRGNKWLKTRNILIIFLVAGFWHGANWTFVAWGAINAMYFLPLILTNTHKRHKEIVKSRYIVPRLKDTILIFTTFSFTTLAWVFFRAENINHALNYISGIFSVSLFTKPQYIGYHEGFELIVLLTVFIIIEWLGRKQEYAVEWVSNIKSPILKYLITYFLIMLVILFMANSEQEFIYFQF